MVEPLESKIWQFLTAVSVPEPCDPAIPLLGIYFPGEAQAFISNMEAMFLHKNIPSSFIRNTQGLPTVQTSTSRRMLWYTRVNLPSGILPSNRKPCSTPAYNIHGPSECKAQGDKPYGNKHIPGTPFLRRLGWACVLCSSQIRAAQVMRRLVNANAATYRLPATRLSGCKTGV